MIGINYYDPPKIARFLSQAGLGKNAVCFNPRSTEGLSCIVQVGGKGIRATHCYVSRTRAVPTVFCLDPRTVMAEPLNRVFILCALSKAKDIDDGTQVYYEEEVIIPKTLQEIEDWFRQTKGEMCVDIETAGKGGHITCIGFARKQTDIGYTSLVIPFDHYGDHYWNQAEEMKVWKIIAREMATEDVPKVFQNFIFDTMHLSRWGIQTCGALHDTMCMAHLMQPELPKSLKDLARLYLYCDTWKDQGGWESHYGLWKYNGRDTMRTLQIFHRLTKALKTDRKRYDFYFNQQSPLMMEILRMCERGWNPDLKAIEEIRNVLEPEIAALVSEMRDMVDGLIPDKVTYVFRKQKIVAGAQYCRGVGEPEKVKTKTNKKGETVLDSISFREYAPFELPAGIKSLKELDFPVFEKKVEVIEFNPGSHEQVGNAILGLGFELPKKRDPKTKEWKTTTESFALKKMYVKTKHPFFKKVLEYREKAKIISTYCNVRLDDDGKIRFSINICGTIGGRFSSKQTPWATGFNSQNIPKRFRHISLPHHDDWVIVNMDFKQADPHMVAWLSDDDQMLAILTDPNGDLHSDTASRIVGHDITTVQGFDKDTSRERKLGKEANNGLNYGMGAKKFADRVFDRTGIELSEPEAVDIHRKYFAAKPGIKSWQRSIEQQIIRSRTLSTPFGRKRTFFGHFGSPYAKAKLLQEAYAYIPPTTVADAINAGWLKLTTLVTRGKLRCNVLQQCHDSLKLQCHRDDLDKVCNALKEAYSQVIFEVNDRMCNFPIDVEWGPNWGNLKPYDFTG